MVSSISSGSSDYLAYLLEQLASKSTSSTTSALTSSSTSSTSTSSSPLSASDMFSKLTSDLGGDGKTITKSELESYMKTVESDTTGTYDKGSLGFLKQLDSNWDSISGGSDSITENQLESGMSYLQPPTQSSNSSSNSLSNDLFSALADATDANGDGTISLDELASYLKSLTSTSSTNSTTSDSNSSDASTKTDSSSTSSTTDSELATEVNFISDLIDNFNTFSGGNSSISSNSFYSAMKLPQDPSTVTADQLVSPINISV